MVNRSFLMNTLIEFLRDIIVDNNNKIIKKYIYNMIVNTNYSTDNILENISDDNTIFDNWIRYFKYDKNIIVKNNSEYFSLKSKKYNKDYLIGSIKLYVPINKERIEISVKKIFDYIKNENINCCSKVFPTIRNDNIVIRVFDIDSCEKIIKFVNNNEYIKSGLLDLSPFVVNYQNIGITVDLNCSYHDILADKLYKYFLKLKKEDRFSDASTSDFKKYLLERVEREKDEHIKIVINLLIDNLDGNTDIDTIIKYINVVKTKILEDLIFDIYNIYGYDETLNMMKDYNNISNVNVDNNNKKYFNIYIKISDYNKIINGDYQNKLDNILFKYSGYTKEKLEQLYTVKKEKFYNTIIDTFKKYNCYQEIKLYIKEYINNVEYDYSKTWLKTIYKDISRYDVNNIIKNRIKKENILEDDIELFINDILIDNKENISYEKKEILKNALINTYNNRKDNKEQFIKDAIKQYILIYKINGFTNEDDSRKSVVDNIKPYECFYIISNDKVKLLDELIQDYIYSIMPYLSNRNYNDEEKCKLLNEVVTSIIRKNNRSYAINCLKLCMLGSLDGLRDENKLIIDKCIGYKNILNLIKKVLDDNNLEVLEDDTEIIISSYIDYISLVDKE